MHEAIKQMIGKYNCKTERDYQNALKEIMQEIALLGLWRGKFFEKAAFYGGTALRILYQLDRFSEDLDFSLLKSEIDCDLKPYYQALAQELKSYGFQVKIESISKSRDSDIESAFIKAGTRQELIQIAAPVEIIQRTQKNSVVKIKFEIDTQPPPGFVTESKLILTPTQFYVNSYSPSDLFAGKMHAVLYRKWKNRVKGRDWYDLVWYVSRGIPVHLEHLKQRIYQTKKLADVALIRPQDIIQLLKNKIEEVDFKEAKNDVVNFIKDPARLNIWSKDFFLEIVSRVQFK